MSVSEDLSGRVETSTTSRCFLCHPDPDLLVARRCCATVVSGLGPLCDGYSVVASKRHVPSLADVWAEDTAAIDDIAEVRSRLIRTYGYVLMTEHGRVPLCRDDGDGHEAHCFHAHAIMFPVNVMIRDVAASYYLARATFSSLAEALSHAHAADTYLLISDHPSRYDVLTGPLHAPRQLARALVAHTLGDFGAADWRVRPDVARARRNASNLRRVLASTAGSSGSC